MNSPLRILHLEDDPNDTALIRSVLAADGIACEIVRVDTRAEFLSALERGGFDLIFTDYTLPSFDGKSALELSRAKHPEVPFIFVSGTLGEESAVETLKSGATDYVLKDRLARLTPSVRRALREADEGRERKRMEGEVQTRARQEAAIVEIGQRALAGGELDTLFTEATTLIARNLGVEYCKVLEWLPEEHALLLRAGVGWTEGLVGHTKVDDGFDSQAGYTLLSSAPVIVQDLRTETRFRGPPLLREHRVASGMSVLIQGHDHAFGVLGAHSTQLRKFTHDDIHFLQAISNVLATAIERKRVEATLRKLSSAVKQTADHVFITDRNGVIEYANAGFEKGTGYTQDQVLGKTPRILKSGKHRAEFFENLWQVILSGQSFHAEFINQKKNGELYYEEKTITPIRDAQGNITHFVSTGRDVTERKRVEATLRASEAGLAEAQRIAHIGNWELDLASGKLYGSDEFYRIIGLTAQQFAGTGEAFLPLVPPDDRELINQTNRAVIHEKKPREVDYRVNRPDGSQRVIRAVIEAKFNQAGKATHLLGTIQDITERKCIEEEIRYRANEFGALYETSHDLAIQYDLSALLQTIIERAAALLQAPGGLIYLYDTARQDLELAAAKGYPFPLGIHVDPNHGMARQVMKTLQPFIVDDYQRWEHRRNQLEGIPISAALQVPMLYRGELVGIIAVFETGTSAHKFTDANARLLSLFAAQAASAVHSARLFEETRQRAEQLTTLHHVGQSLNSTLDSEAILGSVIDEAMRVVGASHGCMLVADAASHRFFYRGLRGFTPELVRKTQTTPLFLNQGLNGLAYRTGQIVLIDDVRQSPDYVNIIPQTRAELVVPMIRGGKVLGNIDLQSPQLGAFREANIGFLQALADQAASALENARLFEAETARSAELTMLYDLSRGLADTNDFEVILNLVARNAVETIHTTFARVALVEDGECVVRAAYPVRALGHDLGVGRREAAQTMPTCSRVAQQNASVVLRHDDSNLTELEREALFLGIAQTLCLVPLRLGERALGLLMLGEARREEREPFTEAKIRLARSIGDQAASTLRRAELYTELERAYLQTVLALANAVDAKDSYTADHAQQLAAMALAVGREMGMTPRELEELRYGAILHDIGKIGVPDMILQKPSKLNAEEWRVMRQHPGIGARILAPLPRLSGASQIVRHHHERYDGKGYPDGLKGEAIPLGARILCVVDSYSAIMDERVYKAARSQSEAIAELKQHAGAQFDPQMVETFLKLLERGVDITAAGGGTAILLV